MAAGAVYSQQRYMLDQHAVSLRRTAFLASEFFITQKILRLEYLREIEDVINRITVQYDHTFDVNIRSRLIDELRNEAESAQRTYQELRQGNYEKYVFTDIFEDQGVVKYASVAVDIVTGGMQAVSGLGIAMTGRRINSMRLKGFGVLLMAQGANNIWESITPLWFHGGDAASPLRRLYRALLGEDKGDFAYSAIDIGLTATAAVTKPKVVESSRRLATPAFGDKPGTDRLFRVINQDFKMSWTVKPTPLRLWLIGSTTNKIKGQFIDGDYHFAPQQY